MLSVSLCPELGPWEELEDVCEYISTWPPLGRVWSLRMAQRTGRETLVCWQVFFVLGDASSTENPGVL